jgi:hypothetical protein
MDDLNGAKDTSEATSRGASLQANDSKEGDGKLRVEPRPVVLSNPEAISDPEYSDEENVLAGETIGADEGMAKSRAKRVC